MPTSMPILKMWIGKCRVFYCYLQNSVSSLIASATFSTFFFLIVQNNIAMRSPVLKQVQILCECLNLLHMPGRGEFSFKGPNSGNRYFINLNEQNLELYTYGFYTLTPYSSLKSFSQTKTAKYCISESLIIKLSATYKSFFSILYKL